MTQSFLWKRFTDDSIESYVGEPNEPILDLRTGVESIRICDGVTPSGNPLTTDVFYGVVTPSIDVPVYGTVDVVVSPLLSSSMFIGFKQDLSPDTHTGSRWQIASDSNFNTIVHDSGVQGTELTSYDLEGKHVLAENDTFYARVLYQGSTGETSGWSPITEFSTETILGVTTPTLDVPSTGVVDVIRPPLVTSSGFEGYLTGMSLDTHSASRWQVASDANFANILHDSGLSASALTEYNLNGKFVTEEGATYHVRVMHVGASGRTSQWSNVLSFTMEVIINIITPSMVYPANGNIAVMVSAVLQGSVFEGYMSGMVPHTHTGSRWQISTTPGFTNIVHDSGMQSAELTEYDLGGKFVMAENTTYYARLMYRGTDNVLSEWSPYVSFVTETILGVTKPSVTAPTGGSTNVLVSPTLTSTAFEGFLSGMAADVHGKTQWQISTNAAFTSTVHDTGLQATNLTSYDLSGVITLAENTTHYIRVKHQGVCGRESVWSDVRSFTTETILGVTEPVITSPASGAVDVTTLPTMTSSAFEGFLSGMAPDSHMSSQWQVSNSPTFGTIKHDSGMVPTNLTSYSLAGKFVTEEGETLYVRVKHQGTSGRLSAWSKSNTFTMRDVVGINKPSITAPANSSTNVLVSPTLTSSIFVGFAVGDGNDVHSRTRWQIATNSGFTNITHDSGMSASNLTSYNLNGIVTLSENATYYVRVMYQGVSGQTSAWSNGVSFTTETILGVTKPSITSPSNGTTALTVNPTVTSSAFEGFLSGMAPDTHYTTQWQVATNSSFTNIVHDSGVQAANKTSYNLVGKYTSVEGQTYYVRVQYRGESGRTSAWSNPVSYSMFDVIGVNKPSITAPSSGSTNVLVSPSLSSSAFVGFKSGDGAAVHSQTRWQISTSNTFATMAFDSGLQNTNLTSINLSGVTTLAEGVVHYARVMYRSTEGVISEWSNSISFTTEVILGVTTPTVTSPPSGNTVGTNPTITTSAFEGFLSGGAADTHSHTQVQVSTNATFTAMVHDSGMQSANLTSYSLAGKYTPVEGQTYYVRVKHRGTSGRESAWSPNSNFNIHDVMGINRPGINLPTINQTNVLVSPLLFASQFVGYLPGNALDTHSASRWEIGAAGVGVVHDSGWQSDHLTSYDLTGNVVLAENTTHYVRVMYRGSTGNESDWSGVRYFTTETIVGVTKPVITAPANGATGLTANPTVVANAFEGFGSGMEPDSHGQSQWQVSTNSGFTGIVYDSNMQGNDLTSINLASKYTMVEGQTYYVRVKYQGITGRDSAWSDVINFTMFDEIGVNTPSITSPVVGTTDVGTSPVITGSAFIGFAVGDGADTHSRSRWQVATNATFTELVYDSGLQSTHKQTIDLDGLVALAEGTEHFVRVMYEGATAGLSAWSSASSFTTLVSFTYTQVNKLTLLPEDIFASELGTSVRVSDDGNTMLVTAFSDNNGNSYIYKRTPTGWTRTTLTGGGISSGVYAHSAVDMTSDGNMVVAGYPGGDTGANNAGHVVFYKWTGSSWSTETIYPPAPTANDYFGSSVAISDNGVVLVIGAPEDDTLGSSAGAIYIATRDVLGWSTPVKRTASDGSAVSFYGECVSISSDYTRICVSAPGSTVGSGGAIYIYDRDIGGSYIESKLTSPISDTGGQYGQYSDMSDDGNIIVGSVRVTTNGNSAVVVKTWNGSSWVEDVLYGPGNTEYGVPLSISGDGRTIAVHRGINTNESAVVVYRKYGSVWLNHDIVQPEVTFRDDFGRTSTTLVGKHNPISVSGNGTTIAIGAPGHDLGGNTDKGAVYIYRLMENDQVVDIFGQSDIMYASNAAAVDGFGQIVSVSANGDVVSVLAPGKDSRATNRGDVYVYRKTGGNWTEHIVTSDLGNLIAVNAKLDATGNKVFVSTNSTLGQTVVLYQWNGTSYTQTATAVPAVHVNASTGMSLAVNGAGDRIVVSTDKSNTNGINYFGADTYKLVGGSWIKHEIPTPTGIVSGDRFGQSLSISTDGNTVVVGSPGYNSNMGTVYVFKWNGTVWIEETMLSMSDTGIGSSIQYGHSVAVNASGDIITVGAPYRYSGYWAEVGSATVHRWNGSVWEEELIIPHTLKGGDKFGWSLDMNDTGDRIVSGTIGNSIGITSKSLVYSCKYADGVWMTTQHADSENVGNIQNGYSVAMSDDGSTIISGARNDDTGGNDSGAAYIYAVY
jgi:hypothetical protein